MRTLEAITITNKIMNNLDQDKQRIVQEFTDNGFVNIDGTINQYVPGMYTFIPIRNDDLKEMINKSIKNKWSTITDKTIINYLLNGLPQFTRNEVTNYKTYIEQYQVRINKELIDDLLKSALEDNKTFQQKDIDFKGKKDLISQLIVLRNANVFTTKDRLLFRYKDGKFERFKSNDVVGLFNDKIGTDDVKFTPQEIKNRWKDYASSLTDITKLIWEIRVRDKKESILNSYESDYKKVLKIIKQYA